MTFREWRKDCPRLFRACPTAEEVCAIRDHALIRTMAGIERVEHSVFFECSEKACVEWQELYGERRVY